jgi:two-component system, LytTR family, sensor kinase
MFARNRFISLIRKYSFNQSISAILFGLLTTIALVRAFQQYYIISADTASQSSLWWHIPFNLFLWWIWFLFLPVIYWITVTLSNKSHTIYYWALIYIFLPVCIIGFHQTIASMVAVFVRGESNFSSRLYQRTINNRWIWLDIVAYFSIVIVVRIVEYQKKNVMDKLKYTQLQSRLVQSQLNALKSQLQPHFLFNTLNSVSTSIILKENEEAKRMLSLIKNFLKTTVDESDQHEIPFKQELHFINQYLEIERVRFEDKLKIVQEIAPETLQAVVPSFLLLPLVENSIYHAIAPSILEGIIRITSQRENETLTIIVEDNGPGVDEFMRKKKPQEGVGIKITKDRLHHLFGDHQSLTFENGTLGGLKVTIKIPFKKINLGIEHASASAHAPMET